MKKENKNLTIGVVLLSLIFITLVISLMLWREQSRLTEIYTYKNDVDFINTSMQRLISLIESEQYIIKDMFFVDAWVDETFVFEDETPFFINNETKGYINNLLSCTKELESNIDTINKADLTLLREDYFKTSFDLSTILTEKALLIQVKINQYHAIIVTLLVSMVVTMLNFPFKLSVKSNADFICEN